MKKNKILVFALTAVMAASVFAAAGCDNGGNGGDNGGNSAEHTEHTYGSWQYNDAEHWRKCTGCDEEERGNHSYGGGDTCAVCGYENESLKPGEAKAVSAYFDGVKVKYERTEIIDADGTEKSFNEILDRQFDLLAQDILYRLTYVYGYNQTTHNRSKDAKYTLKNGENDFLYQGENAAAVDSNKLLALTDSVTDLKTVTINNIEDFQKSITLVTGINYLLRNTALDISGAIEGRNLYIVDDGSVKTLSPESDKSKQWNWYSDANSTYSEFATQSNVNKMKMAIAQVAANKAADGNYSEAAYNTALAEIGALGFDGFNSAKLVKFIKSNVIGDRLVNRDDEYAGTIKTAYGGIINAANIKSINNNGTYTDTDNPRLYKGYSIVVPAIVKQALENTFEGTEQSIYPRNEQGCHGIQRQRIFHRDGEFRLYRADAESEYSGNKTRN